MIELINFKQSIFKYITCGSNIKTIIEYSSKILNAKICFSNLDHSKIIHSSFTNIETIISKFQENESYISKGINDKFNNNLSTVNYCTYDNIIIVPIQYNYSCIGYLFIKCVEFNNKLNYFSYLADSCGILFSIADSNTYNYTDISINRLINELIDKNIVEIEFSKRIEKTKVERYNIYKLISCNLKEKNYAQLKEILFMITEKYDLNIFFHKDTLLILSDSETNFAIIQELIDYLHENYSMFFCFSDSFNDLFIISTAYQQVKTTNFFAIYLQQENTQYVYDDYKIYEAICNVPPKIRNNFICNAYYKMEHYDKLNSTEYIKTITIYILNDKNIIKTSEQLFIHKNTLFYRFKRINELFNINCDNNKELFKMHLAFIIIKLNSIELDYSKLN